MSEPKKIIITFHTTDEAMYLENVCKKEKISGRLIPIPRALSAGCGFAFSSELTEKNKLETIIEEKNIDFDQFLEYP